MNREVRVIFLALLTLSVYAVTMLIDKETLIFPFPLNQFLFLAVCLQFAYWNRKQAGIAIGTVLTALFWTASSQVTWTLVLPLDKVAELVQSDILEWFLLGFYIMLATGLIIWTFRSQNVLFGALFALAFVSLTIGAITPYALFIPLALSFATVAALSKPVYRPYHLLWMFLLILETTEWLTVLINGGMM